MSALRFFILFAVAAVAFLGISENIAEAEDSKIGPDMSQFEEDHGFDVTPADGGPKSSDGQPILTNDSTNNAGVKDVTKAATKYPIIKDMRKQFPEMFLGMKGRAGRLRRGAKKAPKIFPPKDVPAFLGNSKTSCLLPEIALKTAEIRCKLTPTFKICKSYCVFGYTYEEGIVKTSQCNYLENRWSQEFAECKPFIDCYLKLIAPGSLNCHTNEVEKPPRCEIECMVYEENDPIQKQNFTCNIDGSWDPYLPHCVEPRGNKIMAYPPAEPEHGDILYP